MGILIALIIPNVMSQIDDATQDAETQSLRGIAQAVELYLRETHAFPGTLSALSPAYLPAGDTQLSQNPRGFPRYYVLHPTMATFDNTLGIAANEIPDTRFLLISNVNADAAPTITNATEFDAWWNTDETSTPALKIERGNVGALFRLLNVNGRVAGGSFQIDGVAVNSGCSPLGEHARYHLVGTVVGLDEADTYSVPEVHMSLITDTGYHYHDGYPAGAKWRTVPASSAGGGGWSLWLTTNNDVSGSGAPCLDSWADGEIIQFGDPSLAFEPGTTSGTLSSVANLEWIALGGNLATLASIHYVTRNITVGTTTSYDLLVGDLLFSHHGANLEISPPYIWGDNWELYVFRPDIPGDFSAGTLYLLLNDFAGGHVHSISLVETDTVVGDTTLSAGTFLYSTSGGTKNDIFHFSPTRVGGTSTGTTSTLLDGFALGIANNNEIQGLDLIETTLTIGDTTLTAGTILVTLKNDDSSVGSNNLSTTKNDIFYFDVTETEIGSGNSVATATMLLEGADVGLDTTQEDIRGVSVAPAQ